ncbi:MAG: type II secretion system ATPase GspE [Alphaproteobacteria bacterium]|nr:type II secretion system ATPase GspE [Alphaproteobacteria bacterium]
MALRHPDGGTRRTHGRGDEGGFVRYLVESAKLQPVALERARILAAESKERLATVLTRLGLLSERDLADALSLYLDLPLTEPPDYPHEPILEDKLGARFLREAMLLPLQDDGDGVVVAAVNPFNLQAINAAQFALGRPVNLQIARQADFEAAFVRLYDSGERAEAASDHAKDYADDRIEDDVERLKDIASDAPVIRLVNSLIAQAVELKASDIHLEPMESEFRVRYRLDGALRSVESPPLRLAPAVVSRVKIMAKLNIAERRLPQDGRIATAVRGRDVDLRVATTPTIHGESVVIRILDRSQVELDLSSLGFDGEVAEQLRALARRPHGIVLVTGPTGSGKTTTLYAVLTEINTVDKKILTVEDPVEYHLAGINQVQVKGQIGLSFANTLRSFLRHDPDILMIGEIRDQETGQIAVQAALTGHLILSTLHTNDAPSAVTRLLDMGLQDYLLSSTLNGVAAQRLVRVLCPHCREAYEPLPELAERLGLESLSNGAPLRLWRARGCQACRDTGFSGRTALVEVLTVDDSIRKAIMDKADAAAIRKLALHGGMQSMATFGFRKALAGVTSIDEVLRVTAAD